MLSEPESLLLSISDKQALSAIPAVSKPPIFWYHSGTYWLVGGGRCRQAYSRQQLTAPV